MNNAHKHHLTFLSNTSSANSSRIVERDDPNNSSTPGATKKVRSLSMMSIPSLVSWEADDNNIRMGSTSPPLPDMRTPPDEDETEVDLVVGFMGGAFGDALMENISSPRGGTGMGAQSISPRATTLLPSYRSVASLNQSTKPELLEEIVKLKGRLKEMSDSKFKLMQSSKDEIERLHGKISQIRRMSHIEDTGWGLSLFFTI